MSTLQLSALTLTAGLALASLNVFASDTECHGADGDRATPAGSNGGVPLPEKRSCLNPTTARLIGSKKMDMPAGMVVDKAGNAYIAGETKGYHDTFYGDIFLSKMKPDGNMEWMITYGGKQDDGIHAHDENTEGDGQPAMVAMDEEGNIYVVGRGKSHQKLYAGIALKFNPKGELLWNKHYRPNWKNRGSSAAEFHAVKVQNGVVHIVGVTSGESQTLVIALDAKTGETKARVALDPSRGYNDRLYSLAIDPTGNALYVGGWVGNGGPGLLMKLDFDGQSYAVNWAKTIPLPRGSNFPSMAIKGEDLYVVADIHGGSTYSELHKYNTQKGKMEWVRRYNAGVSNDRTQTHVVKFVGDDLMLAGKVGFSGTHTHVDSFGDGFMLLLDKEGSLKREHFFFTGTNPKSFDAVKDVERHGNDLYVVGWHFGPAVVGEWRNPADYDEIKHSWTEGDRRDYMAKNANITVDDLKKAAKVKDGKQFKEYSFANNIAEYTYFEKPQRGLLTPGSNSVYFFIFKDYFAK
ncbi:MAG: hypothetical protein HOM11_07945 [Methylococcales bacterium]|jgi:hypothetical protein|nr:hypothetical protein [Methylococcales bacterium]MBT7443653.1 hypothetical protein [Methylococcales bacterium]